MQQNRHLRYVVETAYIERYCLLKAILSQPRIRHCDFIRVFISPTG